MTTKQFFQSLYSQFNLNKREIDLIICHVLNLNTAGLFIFEDELNNPQRNQIIGLLKQRDQGKPLAYITGFKSFWSLDFKVNEHTLIPRPETELIVELVLQLTNQHFSGKILDLGTGTGAIALSIAHERPKAQVTAVDYSIDCIKIAKDNQKKYSIENTNIFQSNWFDQIPPTKFDYVVSNPPYIKEDDPHLEQLNYEPISALTAAEDGYSDLKKIIQNAKEFLNTEGKIILEHGYNQHNRVQTLLEKNGYINIVTHKDLAGIPRITTAQLR